MKTLTILEHERLPIDSLSTRAYRSLEKLDRAHSRRRGQTVFDWSARDYIKARNWVGVLQAGDTAIEVLPKIAGGVETIRSNLAHMLAVCRRIPARDRDVAATETSRHPLHEVFLLSFARRLLRELRRGPVHEYAVRRENSTFVRGKIEYAEHFRRNFSHRERTFVAFEEFQLDTRLNQTFRACSRKMLSHARSQETQRCLKAVLLHLADVEDVAITRHDIAGIRLDRQSERYGPVLDFCRMFLEFHSPTSTAGAHATFSLLFPMERVFEEYVARIVQRHSDVAGVARENVHVQSRGWSQALCQEPTGQQRFFLQPDLVIASNGEHPQLTLDTKWKTLDRDTSSVQGVSQADAYQLYAYARRYECKDNVLVYPLVPGVTAREYELLGTENQRLRVELVDLGEGLRQRERDIARQLLRWRGTTQPAPPDDVCQFDAN